MLALLSRYLTSPTEWALFWVLCAALELHFGLLRAAWALFARKTERMTAPKIDVPLPKTEFPDAPAPTDLTKCVPNVNGQGQIECFDKGTFKHLGTVAICDLARIDDMFARARRAQAQWAKSSFKTRRQLCYSLLNYVIEHHRLICQLGTIDGGKTMIDGTLGEVITTCERLQWTIENGEQVLAPERRGVGLISIHKQATLNYYPLGVVSAIVSWNYPFHNIFGPLISAIFAGNAFIGKVSEWSSYYARYYESIVKDGLRKLGYDPDLVHFVTGYADAGQALVSRADKITFIGSPGVGKMVMKQASETLTPVVLELGGKDAAVVLDDADMTQVEQIVLRVSFQNCGQNCAGCEQVIAHTKIYDKLRDVLHQKVAKLTQGPASSGKTYDCGAMTMGAAAGRKIQRLIDDAVKKGAKVLVGGKFDESKPCFYPPTMIVDVTTEMAIFKEEVFGPVLVMLRADSDDDAVRLVNEGEFGLGGAVFSNNVERADRVLKRMKTGMGNVNDFGINYLCQSLPFGGTKISGFDRFAGIEGLRGNCLMRAETHDRIPGVKTTVPPPMQYPLGANSFEFTVHLVKVLYGNFSQMLAGVVGLALFKKQPVQ